MKPIKIELSEERLRRFWDKKTKSFSMELSDLSDGSMVDGDTRRVILKNLTSGKSVPFVFTHRDIDGSGEDTYGWHYRSVSGLSLLLIND